MFFTKVSIALQSGILGCWLLSRLLGVPVITLRSGTVPMVITVVTGAVRQSGFGVQIRNGAIWAELSIGITIAPAPLAGFTGIKEIPRYRFSPSPKFNLRALTRGLGIFHRPSSNRIRGNRNNSFKHNPNSNSGFNSKFRRDLRLNSPRLM